jgi:hypothetical protein
MYPLRPRPGFRFGPGPGVFGHHLASGGGDTWLNVALGLAACAAILAFAGAAFAAFRYSQKATITIEASAHRTPQGMVVAARPSVTPLGPFRFRFAPEDGALVDFSEVLSVDGAGTEDGEVRPSRKAFPGNQWISPGETLTSSLIFKVDPETPRLLGWLVCLSIHSRGKVIRNGLHWTDRDFVPLPE